MEHGSVTLSQLFKFFEAAALVQGSTKHKCRTAVRKAIAALGDVVAAAVTVPMAGEYQVKMRNSGMSIASVRSYAGSMAQVFTWAVENRLLAGNPFAEARRMRPLRREPVTFDPEELADLKSAAADKWRRDPTAQIRWFFIIEIGSTSALRAGEIQNLRWEDIDLETATIHVQYRPDRFGEHWEWGTKGLTDRLAPMSQESLEAAYRLREVAAWRYPTLKRCTCEALQARVGSIPELVRKQPYQDFYIELRGIRELANQRRRARGVGPMKNGGIHCLRKTAVSDWARQGVPMADAQYVAGHRSMMTTREYYVAVDHSHAVESVRARINRGTWAR